MKIRNTIIGTVFACGVLVVSMVTAFATNSTNEDKKFATIGNDALTSEEKTFYEQALEKASTKQREEILSIIQDDSFDLHGEYRRDVLIALGELKVETPRITEADIKKVEKQKLSEDEILAAFNNIAGAPDWQGGNGIPRSVYYLDDKHTEAVFVMLGGIIHAYFDENGNVISEIPITDALPSESNRPTEALIR